MDKKTITRLKQEFDAIIQSIPDSAIEFWFARDLQKALGYDQWKNFRTAITRAMDSCSTAGAQVDDHFGCVEREVQLGSGAERAVEDFMLTRYACYLVAQNGDPRKEPIAFAQSYFAVQTRKQEVIEERLHLQSRIEAREQLRESETLLSKNIYERGVDGAGFGRIRSRGDKALFGLSTKEMKERYGISQARPLADFLPTLSIAAKNLATEMTNHTVQRDDLHFEAPIAEEHVRNNRSVRDMLVSRDIRPESIPPEEDIQKLERRVRTDEASLERSSAKILLARKNKTHGK